MKFRVHICLNPEEIICLKGLFTFWGICQEYFLATVSGTKQNHKLYSFTANMLNHMEFVSEGQEW